MIRLISAPSNLGLRPPQTGSVPGTAKAPEALREAGLHSRLLEAGLAVDGGVVLPGRYRDDDGRGPKTVRNQAAILDHAERLSARIGAALDAGQAPLVLGGDCSLLISAGRALLSRGRHGLVHLDGHTDFRHPGNSSGCASLAGEDLAAAVGLHWPELSTAGGRGPFFRPLDAVHAGCRDDDEHLEEARRTIRRVVPARSVRAGGALATAALIRDSLSRAGGAYWLHLDVDILDPAILWAVDTPSPGGLDRAELVTLLKALAPSAAGAEVTIFDPDLDPDGSQAALVADVVLEGLGSLGSERRGGGDVSEP